MLRTNALPLKSCKRTALRLDIIRAEGKSAWSCEKLQKSWEAGTLARSHFGSSWNGKLKKYTKPGGERMNAFQLSEKWARLKVKKVRGQLVGAKFFFYWFGFRCALIGSFFSLIFRIIIFDELHIVSLGWQPWFVGVIKSAASVGFSSRSTFLPVTPLLETGFDLCVLP